jgi:hypothetical protein
MYLFAQGVERSISGQRIHERAITFAGVFEPVRRQRRVDRGAGDGPMPQQALDRTGVVALVDEGVCGTSFR